MRFAYTLPVVEDRPVFIIADAGALPVDALAVLSPGLGLALIGLFALLKGLRLGEAAETGFFLGLALVLGVFANFLSIALFQSRLPEPPFADLLDLARKLNRSHSPHSPKDCQCSIF